jgi:hypothetical protein
MDLMQLSHKNRKFHLQAQDEITLAKCILYHSEDEKSPNAHLKILSHEKENHFLLKKVHTKLI